MLAANLLAYYCLSIPPSPIEANSYVAAYVDRPDLSIPPSPIEAGRGGQHGFVAVSFQFHPVRLRRPACRPCVLWLRPFNSTQSD